MLTLDFLDFSMGIWWMLILHRGGGGGGGGKRI